MSFPLPVLVNSALTAEMQLISSKLGVVVIRAFDIPVYLEGNVIDIGVFQLQVVEACSGLRYMYPLLSLSLILAYLFKVAVWKRVVIFLSAIPITIFMNSFRIGMIGVLVEYKGIGMAQGFLHDFEGWIIFVACLFVLVVEMWLISFSERKSQPFSSLIERF
jgi:exosortase